MRREETRRDVVGRRRGRGTIVLRRAEQNLRSDSLDG